MNLENLSFIDDGINYFTNISWFFQYSRIYALIGDTTVNVFLRTLCRLLPVTGGVINNVHNEKIAFFLNDMKFLDDLNIYEILEIVSNNNFAKEKIDNWLSRLDLIEDSKTKIKKCLPCQLKKLGILCTLVENSKIIIIEDVFKDLLASDIDNVKEIFIDLRNTGYLIILSGRVKDDFLYFADNILELEKGSLNEIL